LTSTSPRVAGVADPLSRYTLLSFLQWLPVGLMMVPMVLLLLERGFTLTEVAAIGVVSGITVGVLELPTGGLADVLGRRPVLVVSALAHAAALVLLGLCTGLALLVLSAGLRGLARALSSGPLEAWYVDTAHAFHADGDGPHLTSGLARGEVAASVALGTGTLVGGGLPLALKDLPLPFPALAAPILLAALVELVRVAFTAGLPDVRRPHTSVAAVARSVPATVGSGLRLAGQSPVVLRLLLVAATSGVALAVLELVTPAWLDRLSGDTERAAVLYAALVTVGFGADAVGAALAPVARRRLATPEKAAAAATALALVAMLGLVGAAALAGLAALALALAGYALFFVGLGAAGPPLGELLHGQVSREERATMLSVQSLVLQLAGTGGAVLAGAATSRQGAWVGFTIAAVALVAAVHMLRRWPATSPGRRREALA
jgi:hypothetical protein